MSRRLVVAAAAAASLAACWGERRPEERRVPPRTGQRVEVETTRLVAGPARARTVVRNPYDGDVHALDEGRRFYTWFNCAGCHGAIGGGGIGPPLRDPDWIYGGEPLQVYRSIVEGRPQGMPAYRERIPEDALWKIVAYVHAFGGAPAVVSEPGAPIDEPEQAGRDQPTDEERHEDE